ncbi:hypothetical protein [Planobispora longispora]|nr:hypothetical protein [Planobispora longispora]
MASFGSAPAVVLTTYEALSPLTPGFLRSIAMDRFRFLPYGGFFFMALSMMYMAMNVPGETAPTAAVIRWAGMGIAIALCGVIGTLSLIAAVLIERFKNEGSASGGDARLRDDRSNEYVEP